MGNINKAGNGISGTGVASSLVSYSREGQPAPPQPASTRQPLCQVTH